MYAVQISFPIFNCSATINYQTRSPPTSILFPVIFYNFIMVLDNNSSSQAFLISLLLKAKPHCIDIETITTQRERILFVPSNASRRIRPCSLHQSRVCIFIVFVLIIEALTTARVKQLNLIMVLDNKSSSEACHNWELYKTLQFSI